MIKKQEPAESILARQDSEDDESFGDMLPAPATTVPLSGRKAAGEWKIAPVTTPHHGVWPGLATVVDETGHNIASLNEQEAIGLVRAINAAIAAERSLTFDWVISMQCKLAAERKRYDDLQRSVMDLSHPNCKMLLKERNEAREQLATERERTARYSMQADDLNGENQQLREQLATKQEQWDTQFTATITILGKTQQQLEQCQNELTELKTRPA